jgi:hypothetical protein
LELSFNFSFLRTTPARKPRTECCCQPVVFIIAAIVVPPGEDNNAMTRDCFEPRYATLATHRERLLAQPATPPRFDATHRLIFAGRYARWNERRATLHETRHEPAGDIDIATANSQKALDPNRPIRGADMALGESDPFRSSISEAFPWGSAPGYRQRARAFDMPRTFLVEACTPPSLRAQIFSAQRERGSAAV